MNPTIFLKSRTFFTFLLIPLLTILNLSCGSSDTLLGSLQITFYNGQSIIGNTSFAIGNSDGDSKNNYLGLFKMPATKIKVQNRSVPWESKITIRTYAKNLSGSNSLLNIYPALSSSSGGVYNYNNQKSRNPS